MLSSTYTRCNIYISLWSSPNVILSTFTLPPTHITTTSSPSVAAPKEYRTKYIQYVIFVMRTFRRNYLCNDVWPFDTTDIFSVSPYQYFPPKNGPPVVSCSFNMWLHQNLTHVSCFLYPRNISHNYNYTWKVKINVICETAL